MAGWRTIKLIESVEEWVSLRVITSESRVGSDESGRSDRSNWGSVNGVVGLAVLVQVNAFVTEIVEEFSWVVGKDGNLTFAAGGLDLSGGSSGSLDEGVGERSAVSVGESSAVVQTGVGVVVGQESGGCGVDWDIGLAVLVQVNALRQQVIGKLSIVWGPLAVIWGNPLGGGASQEEADDLLITLFMVENESILKIIKYRQKNLPRISCWDNACSGQRLQ
jgi:hypothetical protein